MLRCDILLLVCTATVKDPALQAAVKFVCCEYVSAFCATGFLCPDVAFAILFLRIISNSSEVVMRHGGGLCVLTFLEHEV